MKRAQIGRRELLQRGAAIAAIAAVGVPLGAKASTREDAELRALWSKYLPQLEATKRATGPKEAAYEAIFDEMGQHPWGSRKYRNIAKKHNRDALLNAWMREMKKVDAILKAIAKAPAVGLTGVSVKAAVIEAHRKFDEDEFLIERVEKSLFADIRRISGADIEGWS
jgi:hypothetical protein